MTDISAIDSLLANAIALGEQRAKSSPIFDIANADKDDLDQVWERIEYHGISAFLHARADELASWPECLVARLADEARIMGLWEALHAPLICSLIQTIHKAGITSVLMKGTALAYSVYADPYSRRRGDTDLLIPPERLEMVQQILLEQGWSRNPNDPQGLVYQEGWLKGTPGQLTHHLDLHWKPAESPVLRRVLSQEEYVACPVPLQRLDPIAQRADLALTLVHCTLNQATHSARGHWSIGGTEGVATSASTLERRRLIWSMDFVLIIQAMNEAEKTRLIELSRRHRLGPLIRQSLSDAFEDLGVPIPYDLTSQLDTQPLEPLMARYLAESDKVSEVLLDVKAATTWGERWRMLKDRALHPRSQLVAKYPSHSHWPTFALQIRSLLGTVKRVLLR